MLDAAVAGPLTAACEMGLRFERLHQHVGRQITIVLLVAARRDPELGTFIRNPRPAAEERDFGERTMGLGIMHSTSAEKSFGSRTSTSAEPPRTDILIVAHFVREGPRADLRATERILRFSGPQGSPPQLYRAPSGGPEACCLGPSVWPRRRDAGVPLPERRLAFRAPSPTVRECAQ